MSQNDSGILQLDNGYWEYRFTIVVDGKKVSSRRRRDECGKPFTTKRAAIKARNAALKAAQIIKEPHMSPSTASIPKMTVSDVYKEYAEKGRGGKAYGTIRKQDSLWNNHLSDKFGCRYIDEISVAEIVDYLTDLYYVQGFAYKYVESFLKMFYLIFGQAYSRNYLDVDTYSKLCLNKGTKIKMPKMKINEDDDIVIFSTDELQKLDNYFSGSNAETAYMLGRYCGLRINECYGLRWENVNIEQGTILIDRQMQYQEGLIKLVPLKTRNAKRTVMMNEKLKTHFQKLSNERAAAEKNMVAVRLQNQTFIVDLNGNQLSSLELVNSFPNGKMQTVNSMKYHARVLKEKLDITFKYHYLRHTYGTLMAEMNTPAHLLCNQMGHGNIRVTQRYYIAMSKTGLDILRNNLEQI